MVNLHKNLLRLENFLRMPVYAIYLHKNPSNNSGQGLHDTMNIHKYIAESVILTDSIIVIA